MHAKAGEMTYVYMGEGGCILVSKQVFFNHGAFGNVIKVARSVPCRSPVRWGALEVTCSVRAIFTRGTSQRTVETHFR